MSKRVYIIVTVLVITSIIIFVIANKIKNKVIFMPSKKYITKLDGESIFFGESSSGDFGISGYLFKSFKTEKTEETKKTKTVIVYSHGNGGNISWYIPSINTLRNFGDVFAYDYPGYGISPGVPTEDNVLKSGLKAFDYISELYSEKYTDIILYGFSLGGAVTVNIASKNPSNPKIKGVILQSTFAKLEDCVFGFGPLLVNKMFRSIDLISDIKYPVCVIHSPGDIVVPFISSKNLYDKLLSSRKLFINLRYYSPKKLLGHNDFVPLLPIKESFEFINSNDEKSYI